VAPAERSGTTARGVPFALAGRSVRITVPATTRRGRRIAVRCGRVTTADLLPTAAGFRSATIAQGSRTFRGRRRMTVRLDRDVSAIAEWCEFDTRPGGRSGAAVLRPRVASPPAPLRSGPGVREGVAEEGGARFLLDGATLTLRTDRPLPPDLVLGLACFAFSDAADDESLRLLGGRAVAIGVGRVAVTVDLGRDVEIAGQCLAEDFSGGGGRDLFTTSFAPAPT